MDMFIEKIVKRRKSLLDFALILLILVAVVAASFLAMLYIPDFALIVTAGVVYLAYYLISMRNIEFEYAVTNGDVDIDTIMNQKKRKRVYSGNCKDFELVARVKSNQYTRDMKECKNVKDFSSHAENADVWFVSLRKEGQHTVILFEPSEKMLDSFMMFIPRKVIKN